MKRGILRRTLSVMMSAVMMSSVLFATGANIFADDTRTAGNNWVFTLDDSDGLYKHTDDDSHTWIYLNQQVIVEKYDGALPMNNRPYDEFDFDRMYFYVDGNIKIFNGAIADWACYETFDLAGHTISYEPSDNSEPMIKNGGDQPYSYIEFTSSDFFPGTISCYSGATIFEIQGHEYRKSFVTLDNVGIAGGYNKYYYSMKNSAVVVKDNAAFTMGTNSQILNYSSQKGGAIRCEGDGTIYLENGTISGCYAEEGGAIYSTSQVRVYGLDENLIMDNTATVRGGGICLIGDEASLLMEDMTKLKITNNKCLGSSDLSEGGGGVYFEKSSNSISSPGDSLYINGTLNVYDNDSSTAGKENFYLRYAGEDYNSFYVPNFECFGGDVNVSCGEISDGDRIAYSDRYNSYNEQFYSNFVDGFSMDDPDYSVIPGVTSTSKMYTELVVSSSGNAPALLKGYSLVLDGDCIGIKFYVYLPDSEELGSASNNIWTAKVGPSSGSKFYVNGTTVSTLDLDSYEKKGGYVTFTYKVDAADMTVPLDFTLEKNGNEVLSKSGLTVRSYIEYISNHKNQFSTNDYNVAMSLANYGAATQTYFNFRKNDLPNKNIDYDWEYTDAQTRFLYQYSTDLYVYDHLGENAPVKYYGMTMSFKSQPTLKLYFSYSSSSDFDKSKIRLTQEEYGEIVFIEGTQYFYVALKNQDFSKIMKENDFGLMYVYYGSNHTVRIDCSTLWYLYSVITAEPGTYSDKMVDLAKAYTYYFYMCAKNLGM